MAIHEAELYSLDSILVTHPTINFLTLFKKVFCCLQNDFLHTHCELLCICKVLILST